jgi:NADP-dependent 3-hydroxy acid dehydrogenase YdfG
VIGMKELTRTSAFVTGAVSGIGLGIATALILAARKVMLCDVEQAALAAPAAGSKQAGVGVYGVRAGLDQIRGRNP